MKTSLQWRRSNHKDDVRQLLRKCVSRYLSNRQATAIVTTTNGLGRHSKQP